MKLSSKYFDEIRSKKTEKESTRDCESLGCKESGDYIAKSKNGNVNYYCIEHIRLHNKNYNFFSDMSEDEIIDFQVSSMTGHRPTWKMSSNGNSSQKDYFESNTYTKFEDPFGFFKDEKGKSNLKNKNSINQALEQLGLEGKPSKKEIRVKFKELVKTLHPDTNGNNKKNEEKLKIVINAYNKLKTSGLC